jgi:hypothetical protein
MASPTAIVQDGQNTNSQVPFSQHEYEFYNGRLKLSCK